MAFPPSSVPTPMLKTSVIHRCWVKSKLAICILRVVPADGYKLSKTYTLVTLTPTVDTLRQWLWPLCWICTNSPYSMSYVIIRQWFTSCNPEIAGLACFKRFWGALMILSFRHLFFKNIFLSPWVRWSSGIHKSYLSSLLMLCFTTMGLFRLTLNFDFFLRALHSLLARIESVHRINLQCYHRNNTRHWYGI